MPFGVGQEYNVRLDIVDVESGARKVDESCDNRETAFQEMELKVRGSITVEEITSFMYLSKTAFELSKYLHLGSVMLLVCFPRAPSSFVSAT